MKVLIEIEMMLSIVYEMKLLGLILSKSTKKPTHLCSNLKVSEIIENMI
jgi:hypothetical protein